MGTRAAEEASEPAGQADLYVCVPAQLLAALSSCALAWCHHGSPLIYPTAPHRTPPHSNLYSSGLCASPPLPCLAHSPASPTALPLPQPYMPIALHAFQVLQCSGGPQCQQCSPSQACLGCATGYGLNATGYCVPVCLPARPASLRQVFMLNTLLPAVLGTSLRHNAWLACAAPRAAAGSMQLGPASHWAH